MPTSPSKSPQSKGHGSQIAPSGEAAPKVVKTITVVDSPGPNAVTGIDRPIDASHGAVQPGGAGPLSPLTPVPTPAM